ncbi:MAG: hypothetical protein ACXWAV_08915, partial [Chthoniobacterales bacterium]
TASECRMLANSNACVTSASFSRNSFWPSIASVVAPGIDPSAVERVVEQQPLQSIGMITDVEPFLRELADYLSGSKVRQ